MHTKKQTRNTVWGTCQWKSWVVGWCCPQCSHEPAPHVCLKHAISQQHQNPSGFLVPTALSSPFYNLYHHCFASKLLFHASCIFNQLRGATKHLPSVSCDLPMHPVPKNKETDRDRQRMRKNTEKHTQTHAHTYTQTHVHTHTHTHTHVRMRAHTHTWKQTNSHAETEGQFLSVT